MDTIPPLSLPILLDGATGSELYKRGMPAGACTEQWVLGHPEALLELQRGYVAGSCLVRDKRPVLCNMGEIREELRQKMNRTPFGEIIHHRKQAPRLQY